MKTNGTTETLRTRGRTRENSLRLLCLCGEISGLLYGLKGVEFGVLEVEAEADGATGEGVEDIDRRCPAHLDGPPPCQGHSSLPQFKPF